MKVQVVAIEQEPDQQREERAVTFQRWIRGFIQNELNLIEQVCKPSPEQAQRLVDTAETEWKSRLSNSIRAYVEAQNQRVSTDIEARIERMVQIWVRDILPETQQQQWEQEIDARLAYRKRIVIGRMVGEAERRFGLTFSQMRDIEIALKERWKDSWWSMYRSGTLPETKFAWISKILSDSQRSGGTDRNSRSSESFVSGTSIDMPSLDLQTRFRLGDVFSSSPIPPATDGTKIEPSLDIRR
jgi:hypothetical protein